MDRQANELDGLQRLEREELMQNRQLRSWEIPEDKNPGRDGLTFVLVGALFVAIFMIIWFGFILQNTANAAELPEGAQYVKPEMTVYEACTYTNPERHDLTKFTWVKEKIDEALAEKARVEEEERLAAEYEAMMAYYAEQGYYSGGGGSGAAQATTLSALINGQGYAQGGGYTYTWYPNDIGWGNIEDRVPGIHYVDEVAYDGDGYLVVAGSSYNPNEPPVEVDTAYGPARIYDSGSPGGNLDIYTNR